MLSILQRQSKLLEKELKDKQKEVLSLNQEARELRSVVQTRETRIEVLEAELASLRIVPLVVAESEEPTQDPPEKILNTSEFVALRALVANLTSKLDSCEGKLTFAELRSSVLSLQKSTQEMSHLGAVRKLEIRLTDTQDEIKRLRSLLAKNEEVNLELAQTKDDIGRRDEQLEFLLHVHEASSGYDWVNSGQIDRAGADTHSAGSSNLDDRIQMLQMSQDSQQCGILGKVTTDGLGERNGRHVPIASSTSPRGHAAGSAGSAVSSLASGGQDPVSVLEEMGVDASTAIAALEACGGDLDRAVLSLFPID